MEIIDRLVNADIWDAYLEKKISQQTMTRRELDDLRSFIVDKEYISVAEKMKKGEYAFPIPSMQEINRLRDGKKRIVYTLPEPYRTILKVITYMLHKYDGEFPDNLYSFKEHTGVKKAVRRVASRIDIEHCYTFKTDVHDYFNSIDVELLLPMLGKLLVDEPKLLSFLTNLLTDPRVIYNGEVIEKKKGVMAGLPISGFMANLYLTEMDRFFEERNIPYIRYSDDVIVFAEDQDTIKEYENVVGDFLGKMKLSVNPSKVVWTVPGEPVEFLGFRFEDGSIDVSKVSLMKIKGKMRRKARKLYRWKLRKGVDNERAIHVYIRFLEQKFYENPLHEEITWCKWYFPVLTTDRSLRIIDEYAVECIRYIVTGKHGKKNYNLKYEFIKEMGFRSLVNSFWKRTV